MIPPSDLISRNGVRGAAGSSADVDVRGHVEVDTSKEGEPTQAPMGRRVAGAR